MIAKEREQGSASRLQVEDSDGDGAAPEGEGHDSSELESSKEVRSDRDLSSTGKLTRANSLCFGMLLTSLSSQPGDYRPRERDPYTSNTQRSHSISYPS